MRAQVVGRRSARSQDARRAESVLAKRRDKAQVFFLNSADMWDKMRAEMIGERTDLLALLDLLDEDWVVGDLGCGAGHITEALAPCVATRDRRRRIRPDARRRAEAARVASRTSSFELARSKRCRSTTRRSMPRCCFSSRISSPIPRRSMREIRRVLKPGGRLLIVDLMSHDRVEYIVQLGHVWQGFDGEQVKEWLANAGFDCAVTVRCRPTPKRKVRRFCRQRATKPDESSSARSHRQRDIISMGVAELIDNASDTAPTVRHSRSPTSRSPNSAAKRFGSPSRRCPA